LEPKIILLQKYAKEVHIEIDIDSVEKFMEKLAKLELVIIGFLRPH